MNGYDELRTEVIDCDLCTRCGTCIGVCPTHTLAYIDKKIVDVKKKCIQCGMCNAVCIGKSFLMDEWSKELFEKQYDVKKMLGNYKHIWNAYSNTAVIRNISSSGGVVTQILIDLLEAHIIEGAVAVRSKKDKPYEFEPFIAVEKEQILAAAQSKYVIIPVNQILWDLKKSGKKIAYVGVPCQIQGMRKAMKHNKWLEKQVVVLISLFCGFNMEDEATDYLISQSGINKNKIEKLSYRYKNRSDTGFCIKGDEEESFFVSKHGYTFLNLIFSPERCWKCFDYSGEFADISVGDAWEKGLGFSRVIIRTEIGNEIFERLRNQGTIVADACDEAPITVTQQKIISYKKRQIGIRKRKMKYFPDYGVEFENCTVKTWMKGFILYRILIFFKKPVGKKILPILPFKLMVKISERIKGREVIRNEN